ncbi:MAG: rhomboid family intramembrane serine protease [Thermoprotei archaeon]|nr:MAG: rhomboid family intramembrane serine protease [Thermoprotei archaeon]
MVIRLKALEEPSLVKLLVVANLLVYAFLAIKSRNFIFIDFSLLALYGQCNYYIIFYGWYWQMITSLFVHANLLHLTFNMIYLYAIGQRIEKKYGPAFLVFAFLASGLAGNCLSLLWGPSMVTVGASGGVLGLAAVEIMIGRRLAGRGTGSGLLTIFSLFLINSIMPSVDILGHLGGIICGSLIGYLYSRRLEKNRRTYSFTIVSTI